LNPVNPTFFRHDKQRLLGGFGASSSTTCFPSLTEADASALISATKGAGEDTTTGFFSTTMDTVLALTVSL
jgi:hypothetical protein